MSIRQADTLTRLFDAIKSLMAETIDTGKVDDIVSKVIEALAYFERDFPIALLVKCFVNIDFSKHVSIFFLLNYLTRYHYL